LGYACIRLPALLGQYPENTSTTGLLCQKVAGTFIKDEIRTELEAEFSGEINETIFSILKTEDLSKAYALRDSLIESVFGSIFSSGFIYRVRFEADKSGGARIVMSLWSSS
jgi:hypothetical protein